MNDKKRRALMEEAARYREQMAAGTPPEYGAEWACGRGHRWDESLDVAQNVRCMNCASQRREAETKRLQDIARVRGGWLASSGPIDPSMPLDWLCAHGHAWAAFVHEAQRQWSAQCAKAGF